MKEYKERVNDYFLHKKGEGLILSPQNWMVIGKWEKMGIPLNIVVQGIDRTFENVSQDTLRGRKIHLLSYCEPEILNLWGRYKKKVPLKEKKAQPEKQPRKQDYINERIAFLISLMVKYCEDHPESELTSVAYEMNLEKSLKFFLKSIQNSLIDKELIEKRLQEFDRGLFRTLLSSLPPQRIENLRYQVEQGIQEYKNQMQPEAYEETMQEHFMERLRKEFGWFRLSLWPLKG